MGSAAKPDPERDVDAIIEEIVATIRDEYQPEKIILFGSRIWGEPHEDSDLDILVIKKSEKREIARMQEVTRLVSRFKGPPRGLPIDVLVKTPSEVDWRLEIGDCFIRDIMTRGRVAYDRALG